MGDSGALYRICMPEPNKWNGDLVVYAHGYVAPNEPLAIPEDQLEFPGGLSIPEIVNKLGFAFATTSYSINGLAVREGIEDLRDLVDIFSAKHGNPRRVYLVGASEGGIITALAVEPFDIPQELINNWDSHYENVIRPVILNPANQGKIDQLLRVARIPTDRQNPDSVEGAIQGLLWYNVFATNDGIAKLGGQPFDNMHRFYRGSDDDFRLNRQVQRFPADPAALEEIETHYQTSGALTSPLITLHTIGDPFVPYWHELLYRRKVDAGGSTLLHSNIPVLRYGHCNFRISEVLVAFALLVLRVTRQELTGTENVLPDADSQAEFRQLGRQYGALH
jgi:hypothetical protein